MAAAGVGCEVIASLAHPDEAPPTDAVAMTFREVRENIDAVRAMYPGRSDLEIAHAMLKKANANGPTNARETMLLGLVATVLHFAAKHAR
jgi:hypothetical protein